MDPEFRDAELPPWRFWFLSLSVCLGLLLPMMDAAILIPCLYPIATEFQSADTNWIIFSYAVTFLGFSVLFSRLADFVGRRDTFVLAYLIFGVFASACGFAQNMQQLIAFRAVQGVGAAGLNSLAMIILPELSPPRLRPSIACLIGVVVALTGFVGPFLGDAMMRAGGWRQVFHINDALSLGSLSLFILTWPRPRPKTQYLPTIERRSWKELDTLGSILTVFPPMLLVYAFQSAGETRQWTSKEFLAPLILGIFGWIGLVAWESVINPRFVAPAFPLMLFRNRIYSAAALNTLFMGWAYLIIIYLIPMRIHLVGEGDPGLMTGVMLILLLVSVGGGSTVAGLVNERTNFLFGTVLTGSVLMLIGSGLLVSLSDNRPGHLEMLIALPLVGLAFGLTVAMSMMLVGVEAPIREFAPALGILSQLRILGGSLAIAASTGVMTQKAAQVDSGPEGLTDAFWDAFRVDMIIATAMSAAGVVVSLGAVRWKRVSMIDQRDALVEAETFRRLESTNPVRVWEY